MMFDGDFIEDLRRWGDEAGVVWEPGLKAAEVKHAEQRWEIRFPPDLRAFLMTMASSSKGFIHWTETPKDDIAARLDWPRRGFHFDIEHNDLWLAEWGEPPTILAERFEVFDDAYAKVPKLIPIYGHRFIPQEPLEAGNPIFSVYQSDIIYFGSDLAGYLRYEFGPNGRQVDRDPRHIPFWSDWANGKYDEF
ncbi:MAG: SMI1/KNR4 family protein [Pseudomonadota bacterium]